MKTDLSNCVICGTNDVAFGARFNPSPGAPAIYCNFCRLCALNWQSLSPKPPKKWSGQYGGTHAHHTLSVYEPFTTFEIEAFAPDGNIE